MKIERVSRGEMVKYFDPILALVADVYIGTNGKYPRMEWLKPEEKPRIGSKKFFEEFREKYGPFLMWRLKEELDEIYLLYIDSKLVGCIGLNYDLSGKNISWIPEKYYARSDVGFIELFIVSPKFQGRGLGKKLFLLALNRLRELGKIGYVVTFPDLEALKFYEKMGGRIVERFDEFVILEFR